MSKSQRWQLETKCFPLRILRCPKCRLRIQIKNRLSRILKRFLQLKNHHNPTLMEIPPQSPVHTNLQWTEEDLMAEVVQAGATKVVTSCLQKWWWCSPSW